MVAGRAPHLFVAARGDCADHQQPGAAIRQGDALPALVLPTF
jgi:hypothetical protein